MTYEILGIRHEALCIVPEGQTWNTGAKLTFAPGLIRERVSLAVGSAS